MTAMTTINFYFIQTGPQPAQFSSMLQSIIRPTAQCSWMQYQMDASAIQIIKVLADVGRIISYWILLLLESWIQVWVVPRHSIYPQKLLLYPISLVLLPIFIATLSVLVNSRHFRHTSSKTRTSPPFPMSRATHCCGTMTWKRERSAVELNQRI